MDALRTILTVAGGAAGAAAQASGDPGFAAAGAGAQGLIALVLRLIDKHGEEQAEAILKRLVESPAQPITQQDLDEQTEAILASLGLSTAD